MPPLHLALLGVVDGVGFSLLGVVGAVGPIPGVVVLVPGGAGLVALVEGVVGAGVEVPAGGVAGVV